MSHRLVVCLIGPLSATVRLRRVVGDELATVSGVLGVRSVEWHHFHAGREFVGRLLALAALVDGAGRTATVANTCGRSEETIGGALIGELVERLVLATAAPGERRLASLAELEARGEATFDVHRHVGVPLDHSTWPYRSFDRRTPVHWIMGRSLDNGVATWTPTALVTGRVPRRERFVELTSVGTAFHRTRSSAEAAAVREVIERDAVRRAWLCAAGLHAVPAPDRWPIEEENEVGWQTRFFRVATTADLPVWLAGSSRDDGPGTAPVVLGHACGTGRAEHAGDEAVMARVDNYLWQDQVSAGVHSYRARRGYYHAYHRASTVREWLDRATAAPPSPMPSASLRDAVAVDLLSEPQAHVVKVLAPELLTTEGDHDAARMPAAIARAARPSWLLAPHPFA